MKIKHDFRRNQSMTRNVISTIKYEIEIFFWVRNEAKIVVSVKMYAL